jgi:hypothetical protein
LAEETAAVAEGGDIIVTAKCKPEWLEFFAANRDGILAVSQKYDVNPALLLGLSALESAWGTSNMYKTKNNPFGATPRGDSTSGLQYPSITAAWQSWGDRWGPRVQGVGMNVNLFTSFLTQDNQRPVLDGLPTNTGRDNHGPYNTQVRVTGGTEGWSQFVANRVAEVLRRSVLINLSHGKC